jgi:hypothetical protein
MMAQFLLLVDIEILLVVVPLASLLLLNDEKQIQHYNLEIILVA